MLLFDLLIATLVLIPLLGESVSLELPGIEGIELSDMGIPLLIAALIALAVGRWRSSAFTRWSVSGVLAAILLLFLISRVWRSGALEPGLLESATWYLTRGTGGVLVVAAAAYGVRRWTREPWEKSFFVRLGKKLARIWLDALGRSARLALWSAAGFFAGLYSLVALWRHRAFESHGYDLGIFTNAIWNLTHGNGYVSSVKGGINLFADHQSPLFWALAPLFRLVPAPETLLLAQGFGLAAGGPALFYLARARFGAGHWVCAALPWLYWSYLPLRNANAFDFHPEVFMLPLFLWAFAGFESRSRGAVALGVLALLAALGAKESAGVVAAGIGVAWALSGSASSRHSRWFGAALAVVGTAVFFFDVLAVPRLLGTEYAYMGHYKRFGEGIGDLLLAPFTQPAHFFSHVIDRERLIFLFWTLAPLGFLPLFDWRAALGAVPAYLMLFLSEGDQRVRIVFHYGIEPGSVLFWALPIGVAAFAQRFGWTRTGIWMLFWSVACLGPGELARARSYSPIPHSQWLAADVMPCLHPQASMAASDRLIPHVATRAWISYPDQLRRQPSGEPVQCVVTDLKLGNNWPLGRGGTERVLAGLPEQGYREVWRCGDVSVYESGTSGCLRCVPACY
jgi:uncharacterized membrane protein